MFQYLFNDIFIFYRTYDSHFALAFGTYEWVNMIYFLNQPGPILSESLSRNIHIYKGGNLGIFSCLCA